MSRGVHREGKKANDRASSTEERRGAFIGGKKELGTKQRTIGALSQLTDAERKTSISQWWRRNQRGERGGDVREAMQI